MSAISGLPNPAKALFERVGKDGVPRPFSIAEQWERVASWYDFLQDENARDYPVPDGMNEAWWHLEPLYELGGKPIIERGKALANVAQSPLAALFYFVEMGIYPPPELLFALADAWKAYESGAGRVSLEDAFFGRRVQKSGNYAQRDFRKFQRMVMRVNFDRLTHQGLTRSQAAEAISSANGGKPDADSILRMFRAQAQARRKNKA